MNPCYDYMDVDLLMIAQSMNIINGILRNSKEIDDDEVDKVCEAYYEMIGWYSTLHKHYNKDPSDMTHFDKIIILRDIIPKIKDVIETRFIENK